MERDFMWESWARLNYHRLNYWEHYRLQGIDERKSPERELATWPRVRFESRMKYCYSRYFGDHLATLDESTIFKCDTLCPISEDDQSKHHVRLQYLKVQPSKRGQGRAARLIGGLTELADDFGVAIYAICNPFTEDIPEDAKWGRSAVSEGTYLCLKQDYKESQLRCRARLSGAGFHKINLMDEIENKNRITVDDIWIYLPTRLDAGFRNAISYRLISE